MVPLLLLLLPTLASCSIGITLKLNGPKHYSIKFQGYDITVVDSANEKFNFDLTDKNLKDAVKNISGVVPDAVYLHEPTPWGVYKTYNWTQVNRIIFPIKSEVSHINTKHLKIDSYQFHHSYTPEMHLSNVNSKKELTDSITSEWYAGGLFDVQGAIYYTIEPADNYTVISTWNNDLQHSRKLLIKRDLQYFVNEGQFAEAVLKVTRKTVTVIVHYLAFLVGDVACNFVEKYAGHHFWRYGINELLRAGRHRNWVKSVEIVTFRYYTDAEVVVRDIRTNETLNEFDAEISVIDE